MSGPSAPITEVFDNFQTVREKRLASTSPPDEHAAKKNSVAMSQDNVFTPSKSLVRSPKMGKRNMVPSIPAEQQSEINTINSNNKLSYNVNTDNKFDALASVSHMNSDDVVATASADTKMQRQAKVNIPPFVFTSATDFKSGLDIVYKHAKGKHFIKYMRVGTKIIVDSMESYVAIDKEMSIAKIKYFTHDLMVERPAKFVINGLHLMETQDLETELKRNGLEPLQIQCVAVKKPRFDREHIYIIALPSSVTLNVVQKVKFINHVLITWYKHTNKSKGPTQCRKCLLYGHGMRNCHLDSVCNKCGKTGHSAEICNIIEEEFKCSNCQGQHLATDPRCKSRSNFIEMRKKLSAVNNRRPYNEPAKNKGFVRVNDNVAFPALPKHNSEDIMPETSNQARGEWFLKSRTSFNPLRSRISNEVTATPEDLFSTKEILQITKDVLTGLASCKTKQQQLEVIFEICSTYLHGP